MGWGSSTQRGGDPKTHSLVPPFDGSSAFSEVGPKETAEIKGLCVFTLCRLERQARGTKKGTKAGVFCSLSKHAFREVPFGFSQRYPLPQDAQK